MKKGKYRKLKKHKLYLSFKFLDKVYCLFWDGILKMAPSFHSSCQYDVERTLKAISRYIFVLDSRFVILHLLFWKFRLDVIICSIYLFASLVVMYISLISLLPIIRTIAHVNNKSYDVHSFHWCLGFIWYNFDEMHSRSISYIL